jgi:acyl-CoA reductase-like NAD-dependent aldehyde dehydrogenase
MSPAAGQHRKGTLPGNRDRRRIQDPYGGVKKSGLGREGFRFAMEDMTEIRLMVLNRIGN